MKWPSWIKGPLRATPGTAVTGIDQAAVIRRTAQSIWDRALEGEKRKKEQDALWKYEERENIVALVRLVSPAKASARRRYKATTVTEVGGPGYGVVWAEAWTIDDLDPELRFALAQHYIAKGLVGGCGGRGSDRTSDYAEARERAAKAVITLERSFALGSKGEL